MDRSIVYPGSLPQDTDLLAPQRAAMIALGFIMKATFGTATIADGLACTPTLVASMSVNIGPGCVMTNLTVDGTAFGSLAADTADPLMKMGINLASTAIGPFTAPGTAGQSQNFLIQAQVSETDGTPVVLPYYNASNPASPFSGPANSGAAQNTKRVQSVLLQVKSGAPAVTGSQTTPTPDAGFVGLHQITIANGAASIIAGNIVTLPTAPFIPFKLPALTPGFSHMQAFVSSGTFTPGAGITAIKARIYGAGGGGGACKNLANNCGAAGGGGGYGEGILTGLTPGVPITVTIGAAGSGGTATPLAQPTAGGTSSFGGYITSTGGGAGQSTDGTTPTTAAGGGTSVGGSLAFLGGLGGLFWPAVGGFVVVAASGTAWGNPSRQPGSGDGDGAAAINAGDGGGAGITATGASRNGAPGKAGLVVVEW